MMGKSSFLKNVVSHKLKIRTVLRQKFICLLQFWNAFSSRHLIFADISIKSVDYYNSYFVELLCFQITYLQPKCFCDTTFW